MFSAKSTLSKLSYRGYVTSRNIRSLKTLILLQLEVDSDREPILRRTPKCHPIDPPRESREDFTEQLLSEFLGRLSTSRCFSEPSERILWTSSMESCQLQLAFKFQLFLSELLLLCVELTQLGYPHHLLYNNQELSKVLDAVLPLLRTATILPSCVSSARKSLLVTYRHLRCLADKLSTKWLNYLTKRTFLMCVTLNQVQFWSEQAETLRSVTQSQNQIATGDMTLKKARKSFYKLKVSEMIKRYVSRKQKELEICLNCEKAFPSHKMAKHIKTCRQIYEIDEFIETADAEVAAKLQDLKEHVTEVKKMQLDKEKELQQQRMAPRRGFFKKDISKSTMCRPGREKHFNEFDSNDQESISNSNSDSDCSSTGGRRKGPLRALSTLTLEQLISYLWVLDQLRILGNKIRTQRQATNVQLFQDLKNLKTTVQPKFLQLNVLSDEVQIIFRIMLDRMDLMQKARKLKKQLKKQSDNDDPCESFCSQFENFKSSKMMKHERSKYKTQIKNSDECFFSEEESSVRMSEPDNTNCVRLKDFKKIKTLGHGKYGEVWLVRKKSTKAKYAMKRVYVEDSKNYTQLEDLEAENNVFSVINSPYLVKAVYSFAEGNYHYFVMEYMPNGDFAELLAQEVRLYEQQAKLYLAEIVLAVQALHAHGITHRDIKPQNIVIDKNGHLKITDYGLSQAGLVKRKQDQQKNKTLSKFVLKQLKKKKKNENDDDWQRIVGSPYYMAPQVLSGGKSTQLSDWWSFGILICHTLLGVPPFTGNNLDEIKEKVFKLQTWPSCVKFGNSEETISYEAKDLIDKLLVLDPKRRLGGDIEDIKMHSFFDGIDWENLQDMEPPIPFVCEERSVEEEGYETEEENVKSYCGSANQGIKLIRRDILNSETQAKHLRGQAKFGKLLQFANKLQKVSKSP